MRYISGFYALNIPCSLYTTGDWHQSCLDWNKVVFLESEKSIFGDWGGLKRMSMFPFSMGVITLPTILERVQIF